MSSQNKKDGDFVEALARGFSVIQAFDETHAEMTLSEVARRTNLTPATARRTLTTLISLGYMRCVNKRFLLGPRILTLGNAYLRTSKVEDLLMPELRRLVSLYGGSASVGVLDRSDVLLVGYLASGFAARPAATGGTTLPAYPTSVGRVLLSGLAEGELNEYLRTVRFERFTDFTETNPKKLGKLIREVRRKGYAWVVDELTYGVTSMAVPIRVRNGRIVAAVKSAGYSGLLNRDTMIEERLPELQSSARRLADVLSSHLSILHSL